MSDGVPTEGLPVQPSSNTGSRWRSLAHVAAGFAGKILTLGGASKEAALADTPQILPKPEEQIPIPPDSRYAMWLAELESKGSRDGRVYELTANELRRLYPDLARATGKIKLKDHSGQLVEQQKLLGSLNNAELATIIILAEFVRTNYLNGKNILDIRKTSLNTLTPTEFKAVLADQLITRLQNNKVFTPISPAVAKTSGNPEDSEQDKAELTEVIKAN